MGWAPGAGRGRAGGARPGGGAAADGAVVAVAAGAAAAWPSVRGSWGDGVCELQPSAAAATAVSVGPASASGTRDGALR